MPKHRASAAEARPRTHPRLRQTLTITGVAVCATGLAVSSGAAWRGHGSADTASAALTSAQRADAASHGASQGADGATSPDGHRLVDLGTRAESVSRSLSRVAEDPAKKRALSQKPGGQATATEDLSSKDPRTIARTLLASSGFGSDQFSCLDSIYSNESGWNVHADNPTSSAYGIPQALPGTKMASAGPDWENNAATQIKWGIGYIKSRYGSPCSAWGFKQSHGWY